MSHLVTLGSVAFDSIESPFGKAERILGGAGTFISIAASYFVKPVNLISIVGKDFRQDDWDMMQNQYGINMEGIQRSQTVNSFFWAGKYHSDMNRRDTLITELNVLEDFQPQVPTSAPFQNCDYLMLGNMAPAVQQAVIEAMPRRPKLIVMDTMNFWMQIARKELDHTISNVNVLVLNEEEARELTGQYSLKTAARDIQAMGPKIVIIKKGEHGALLFHHDDIFFVPALPLEAVFDPTGAGDTFAGGLIGYIAQQDDPSVNGFKNGLVYGSAMASFCVEKFGVEGILNLGKSEIEERAAMFKKLISFES